MEMVTWVGWLSRWKWRRVGIGGSVVALAGVAAMMVTWCSVRDGGDGDDVEVEVRMWRLLAGYRGRRATDGRNSSGDGAGKTRKESVYG
ncbi:hypothetical protein Tco_1469632 [Tanacetum coccineum]